MPRPIPKEYIPIPEAHEIIVKLRNKYRKMLKNVDPDEIIVMGVSNKSRPESQTKLAVINAMTPVYRAIFAMLNSRLKYFIESSARIPQGFSPSGGIAAPPFLLGISRLTISEKSSELRREAVRY